MDEDTAAWAAAYAAELNRRQYEDDMKASQLIQSKYIRKEDVEPAKLVTIERLNKETLNTDDGGKEEKYVMYFREMQKGLVLNPVNIELCTKALNDDETDRWPGRQVVVYSDPTVMMRGKLVGGVRIRAPRLRPPGLPARTAPPPPPPPEPVETAVAEEYDYPPNDPALDPNDDIPF